MSPKSVIVGRNVPGQDGGGHHVGDRYEEQPGGGETHKPGVFYWPDWFSSQKLMRDSNCWPVWDEDPSGVEKEVKHQDSEEGVWEHKGIEIQSLIFPVLQPKDSVDDDKINREPQKYWRPDYKSPA